jgi:chemotaxis protein MotA
VENHITVSTSQVYLQALPDPKPAQVDDPPPSRRIDLGIVTGIAIAVIAVAAGIATTGVSLRYFFQPTGVLIVLGGTIGVIFITTPRRALLHTVRRVSELVWTPHSDREKLIDEIVSFSRIIRAKGLYLIEPMIEKVTNKFLAEALLMAMDVRDRSELESALENHLRLKERQGEADAKILEVAGGFAPTIGVLGTVVGLINVLRQFSTPSAVASGVGTAFVSTIYGLALANLIMLPAAHRIRARVAEAFETQELVMEGVLCLYDRIHPSLVRQRLRCFLRETSQEAEATPNAAGSAAAR